MKPRLCKHIEKIGFKGSHLSATLIMFIYGYLQRIAEPDGIAAAAPARCGIIRCARSSQVRTSGQALRRPQVDDDDGNRSDERHLARRGRCRVDRDRRQAGQGVRAVRLPALYATASAACCARRWPRRSHLPQRDARPGMLARGRAGGHAGPCRGGRRLYSRRTASRARTSTSSAFTARPCCIGRRAD